jgi:hypothetical protein
MSALLRPTQSIPQHRPNGVIMVSPIALRSWISLQRLFPLVFDRILPSIYPYKISSQSLTKRRGFMTFVRSILMIGLISSWEARAVGRCTHWFADRWSATRGRKGDWDVMQDPRCFGEPVIKTDKTYVSSAFYAYMPFSSLLLNSIAFLAGWYNYSIPSPHSLIYAPFSPTMLPDL